VEQTRYDRLEMVRDKLHLAAVIVSLASIVLTIIFLFIWLPIMWAVILGSFFVWVAWMVPWMGGPLMTAWAALFLYQLPNANWGFWSQFPFYVSLSLFLAAGLVFIAVAVLDEILRKKPAGK
jgi:hypothetical protein